MNPIVRHIEAHAFRDLFVDELGWDRAGGACEMPVDGQDLRFEAVAQKRGFMVLHCTAHRTLLANRALLRRVQRQLAATYHEHILIYSSEVPPKQVWQWAARRSDGRKLRHREHPFFSNTPPKLLIERLERLRFTLTEEDSTTLIDALDRVRAALDRDAEFSLFATCVPIPIPSHPNTGKFWASQPRIRIRPRASCEPRWRAFCGSSWTRSSLALPRWYAAGTAWTALPKRWRRSAKTLA